MTKYIHTYICCVFKYIKKHDNKMVNEFGAVKRFLGEQLELWRFAVLIQEKKY